MSLLGDGVSSEREILNEMLQLCLDNPESSTSRMLLALCNERTRMIRPHIVEEFSERLERLKERYPLRTHLGREIDEAF